MAKRRIAARRGVVSAAPVSRPGTSRKKWSVFGICAAVSVVVLLTIMAWPSSSPAVPKISAHVPPVTPAPQLVWGAELTATLPRYDGGITTAQMNSTTGNLTHESPIYGVLRERVDQALMLAGDNRYAKEVIGDLASEPIVVDFSPVIPEEAGATFHVYSAPDGTKIPTIRLPFVDVLSEIRAARLLGLLRHELAHYHQWRTSSDPALRLAFEGGFAGEPPADVCRDVFENEVLAYVIQAEAEASVGYATEVTDAASSMTRLRTWVFERVGPYFLKTEPSCRSAWMEAAAWPGRR